MARDLVANGKRRVAIRSRVFARSRPLRHPIGRHERRRGVPGREFALRGSAVHLHDRLWADRPGGFADARRSPRLSHEAVRTRIAASEGGRDNCASTPRRRGRRARRIGKDATNRGVAPPHGYAVHAHSDYGGNRFRQGGVRAIPSWDLGRGEGAVHGGQLRRHSRRICWKARFSDTKRARFPARTSGIWATPSARAAACCSSTRSATCRSRCR